LLSIFTFEIGQTKLSRNFITNSSPYIFSTNLFIKVYSKHYKKPKAKS